jgi:protein-S-isoprenylcysteine O-methyltransferase Ste14
MLTLIRYAVLAVPAGLLGVLLALNRPRDRRTKGALLLTFLAAATAIYALNQVARAAGWWRYAALDGSLDGVPVDVWLGWSVLWGPVPLLLRRLPLPVLLLGLGWLDLLLMPRLAPVVELGDQWLLGELAGLTLVVPVQLLGRWTIDGDHLRARTALQVTTFTGLVGWLLPTAVFALGDGGWRELWTGPRWWTVTLFQLLALAAVPGIAAVCEFVARGNGTPYPWDPPDLLVTTGPYAYLANPMQLSATAILALLALGTHSLALLIATVAAAAFSVTVAEPHEREDLAARLGPDWQRYDTAVRPWRLRRAPYVAEPARLYLARTCPICAETRIWVERRDPQGLEIRHAEEYASGTVAGLRRARYAGPDGETADGVAALARALEHCGPGWAYLGWLARLPVIRPVLQLLVDRTGGGPRDLQGVAWHGTPR